MSQKQQSISKVRQEIKEEIKEDSKEELSQSLIDDEINELSFVCDIPYEQGSGIRDQYGIMTYFGINNKSIYVNAVTNKIINVESSQLNPDCTSTLKNIIGFKEKITYLSTKNDPNAFYKFDFKEKWIHPNYYAIRNDINGNQR